MQKRLWLTWEVQRRNHSMSVMLGADLHELVYSAPAWRRYPVLIWRTISLLLRERPAVIFAQNPSLILAALAVTMGKALRTPVVIDAHNAGLYPLEGKHGWLNRLAKLINNRAQTVIVSNAQLKAYVESHGGEAFVIPDPIPEMRCSLKTEQVEDANFKIVYVCSWAEDEPYAEVIKAAADLPQVRIYMTGNSRDKHLVAGDELPPNVVLTGFISTREYEALLCDSDAVMVLTTRDDCLVCGAYEAVAIEKPMILSDTAALRQFFNRGCIYADNTSAGIVSAVNSLIEHNEQLSRDVSEFRQFAIENMSQLSVDFEAQLQALG